MLSPEMNKHYENKTMRIWLLFLFILNGVFLFAQRDFDVITLKDNSQLLGYIIEQKPAVSVSIFRPMLKDTVVTKMEDIDRLSKILVPIYPEEKRESKDAQSPKTDTLIQNEDSVSVKRFNNKKQICQIAYAGLLSKYTGAIPGLSVSYYRNYNNTCFVGASGSIYNRFRSGFNEVNYERSVFQFQLMLEAMLRLSGRSQNKKISILQAIKLGYVFDKSSYVITDAAAISYSIGQMKEEYTIGNFMIQTGSVFKLNVKSNSGIVIEPGYAFYQPFIKQYSNNAYYMGARREKAHFFTFRLGYFF